MYSIEDGNEQYFINVINLTDQKYQSSKFLKENAAAKSAQEPINLVWRAWFILATQSWHSLRRRSVCGLWRNLS